MKQITILKIDHKAYDPFLDIAYIVKHGSVKYTIDQNRAGVKKEIILTTEKRLLTAEKRHSRFSPDRKVTFLKGEAYLNGKMIYSVSCTCGTRQMLRGLNDDLDAEIGRIV